MIIGVSTYIIFLEKSASCGVSDFAARKLCHAGSGAMMMCLDPTDSHATFFVLLVAVSSIAMTWEVSPLPPFRFSRKHDIGITIYLILVSIWFLMQL